MDHYLDDYFPNAEEHRRVRAEWLAENPRNSVAHKAVEGEMTRQALDPELQVGPVHTRSTNWQFNLIAKAVLDAIDQ